MPCATRSVSYIALLLLLLGSCKSTGVDQAEDTVATLTECRSELGKANPMVDSVVESLGVLAKGQGDMKSQFAEYSQAIEAVTSLDANLESMRGNLGADREAFLAGWNERLKKINDKELRERAEERRNKTLSFFEELSKTIETTDASYEGWIGKAQDVRTYLESDLNPSGVASVSDRVQVLSEGAVPIKAGVDSVCQSLDKLIEALAAAKATQESSESKK